MKSSESLFLKDRKGGNDFFSYTFEQKVYIEVFDFECTLNEEDVVKLRDWLNDALKSK